MTGFKEFLSSRLHLRPLSDSSVSVSHEDTSLFLRLDSKDIIVAASYEGPADAWMGSLCELLKEMPLSEARVLNFSRWEEAWRDDQFFWDMKLEAEDKIFRKPLELLHAALDIYRGREFLYHDESPLVCRCFGVREKDILSFLKSAKEPTLEELSKATKAGMGCRSCVPQLKQWLLIPGDEKSRYYKSRPVADWIELIDSALARFPGADQWKMSVESMKGNTVMIGYEAKLSQKEEEEATKKLQGFLGGSVDPELGFFLRRSRQR